MVKRMVEIWIYKETYEYNKKNIRFLLLKRKDQHGGYWQPVVGRLEEGESIPEGAIREVIEETGITPKNNLSNELYNFTIDKHHITGLQIPPQVEHCFSLHVDTTTSINITSNPDCEHDDYLWVKYDEALQLLKWQNNKDALEEIFKKM